MGLHPSAYRVTLTPWRKACNTKAEHIELGEVTNAVSLWKKNSKSSPACSLNIPIALKVKILSEEW